MDWSDAAKGFLALTVYREASGEPYQVKLGIAYSVLDRVARPTWWGHTICQVVFKKAQYSSMTIKGDPNLVRWPVEPDAAFEDCMKAVDAAISESEPNPCIGADSYFDISIPAPNWATPDKFVVKLGKVRFFDTDFDHEKEVTGHV